MKDEDIPSEKSTLKDIILKRSWIFALMGIVIIAFLIEMYSLLQYQLSYGPDGPYYDLQVREILNNWIPSSNDPPLVYYYLTPFVIIFSNSYLGIKIGMALISSLIAIPAFFLTETFTKKMEVDSKIPALLSAFLITVNIYVSRQIEDFMQCLFGYFFVMWFIYFAIRWFEDFKRWYLYGTLTILSLLCSILSHIFTGAVSMVLFVAIFFFNIILKTVKLRKIPWFEMKILIIVLGLGIGALVAMVFIFPSIYSNFQIRLSSYLGSLSMDSSNGSQFETAYLSLITVPFIIGIIPVFIYIIKGLKAKHEDESKSIISREVYLSFLYLTITVLFIFLVVIPSSWLERFVLLAFVPIALIVPIGLKYIEKYLKKAYPDQKILKQGLIGILAILLAMASLVRVFQMIPDMGPYITDEQYNELLEIQSKIPDEIDPDGVINVESAIGFGYWVAYVMDMDYSAYDNLTVLVQAYPGQNVYGIYQTRQADMPFQPTFNYPWNPMLPYSEPNKNYMILQDNGGQMPPEKTYEGIVVYEGEFIIAVHLYDENGNYLGGGSK